jgi:RNA 2',3'-cyclic 3'-phosphodiesterase
MKRIFIAIKVDPGKTMLNMIASFKSGLKDEIIKWTETGNIHVSLVFLGETEDKVIPSIIGMLHHKCGNQGSFILKIKGSGVFKSVNDPRIIWTGIEKSGELERLHADIASGLADIGIRIEERSYNPHLTLGRIKKLGDGNKLGPLIKKYTMEEIQVVPVNEVILYESMLRPSGPVYVPLKKFRLQV